MIKFGGDTGVDADFNQQVVIYIDGYYVNHTKDAPKEEFFDYKCIIGQWDGDENDDDIFYYFEDEADIERNKIDDGNGEFVITNIRR